MFPKEFVWGAATAAYQIEGAAFEDGKGLSIWDDFVHTPGKILDGGNADVGADHYHHVAEDVELMKNLGIKAYRFSISWPRLIPEGTGKVNEKGIAFYSDLIDRLLAAGITPYCTLYHWDLPLALQRKGGWMNREIADWFADYAALVVRSFGDRVKHFFTFNEPSVFLSGYINGAHAPGLKMSDSYIANAFHNVLLAHGKAFRAMSAIYSDLHITAAPCMSPIIPVKEEDVEACRDCFFSISTPTQIPRSATKAMISDPAAFLDPIVFGTYPDDVLSAIEKYLPDTWQEDLKIIKTPIEYIGENIYRGRRCMRDEDGNIKLIPAKPGCMQSKFGWPIVPECIYWGAKFITERYHLPLIYTENGISCHDWVMLDGKVHDPNRIDFTHRYLLELQKALDEGIPVIGYFHWSLMDNIEWDQGYKQRFGLVYVDLETGKRTPKDSYYWYKDVIAQNGANL